MRDSNVLVQLKLTELTRADLALLTELRRKLPELSRAALKILFREKRIRLQPVGRFLSASDDLFPGEHQIEILNWIPEDDLAPTPLFDEKTEPLPVVFEDEDFLILNKLSELPSVPLKPQETHTAVSSALRHLSNTASHSLNTFIAIGQSHHHPLEAGLLHRLDTGTSGLLAFAKNQTEFDRIRSLWKTNQVRKFYRAIVRANLSSNSINPIPKKLPYSLTASIGHDPKSAKRMIALDGTRHSPTRGKPLDAITHVLSARPVRLVRPPCPASPPYPPSPPFNEERGDEITYYDLHLEIETGVMHQIRVHLASIGLPILGDPLYGPRTQPASRLFLHHERLELPLRSGAKLIAHSALPSDWAFFLSHSVKPMPLP